MQDLSLNSFAHRHFVVVRRIFGLESQARSASRFEKVFLHVISQFGDAGNALDKDPDPIDGMAVPPGCAGLVH
jgi:hypothetical protein